MAVNYREIIRLQIDNTLLKVKRNPRKWVLVNVLFATAPGALIGAAVGVVATIASNWSAPWPYIGYLAASLLAKVVFTNIWEFIIAPRLGQESVRFARKERVPVPPDGWESIPSGNLNTQLTASLTVVAACIGTALALGTDESQGSWLVSNIPVWLIIAGVGGIVAAAEALTHKEVMRGIWRNEFSYQRRQRRQRRLQRLQQRNQRRYRKNRRSSSVC